MIGVIKQDFPYLLSNLVSFKENVLFNFRVPQTNFTILI